MLIGCEDKSSSTVTIPSDPGDINSNNSGIIYYNDFDDDPVGIYTVSNFQQDWNYPLWNAGISEGRVSIIENGDAFRGKTMQILYPKGKLGLESGVLWKLNFEESYEELYCSYLIKFSQNFDFVRGGKLPGLAGGKANAGGERPNGNDGWSARIMWREEGRLVQYVYHPDQEEIYGDNFYWTSSALIPNIWYRVETRVVMNTPGQRNGVIQSWLNGQKMLDIQDIRFRDTYNLSINLLRFDTYFGGNTSDWEPDT